MPKLTIFIPNFNYGHYIEKAVLSITQSSYTSYEILIIDDGSTDNSVQVIERLCQMYPQIRFVRHEKNQGVFPTFAEGVRLSRGEYFHILSSDDYRLPGFMEKIMQVLETHPELPLCCSDYIYLPEENPTQEIRVPLIKTSHPYLLFSSEEVISIFRHTNFWIPGHTSIFKKQAIEQYGGFLPPLSYACDWFLLHQIVLKEGCGYLPEGLAVIRQHRASFSSQGVKKKRKKIYSALREILESDRVLRRQFCRAGLTNRVAKALFFELLGSPFRGWKYLMPAIVRSLEWRLPFKWGRKKNLRIVRRQGLPIEDNP